MTSKTNQSFIAYMSTYPPRKCGIATFTQDLSRAMDKITNPKLKSKVIALNDNGNSYDYSDKVLYEIKNLDARDYIKTAQKINENASIKLVTVQHEFKIFGSDYGENLLAFLKAVKKPVITTFHTVLPGPSNLRKRIIQSIAKYSKQLIVMSKLAVEILKEDYDIEESKIIVIPHGIHEVDYEQNTIVKQRLGYEDRILLTSFGFLRQGRGARSSGRGYEHVLEALPNIITEFPNILYLIIGVTHPKYLKHEGEKYREYLMNKVKELGIEDNVMFINRYVDLNELFEYLKATDVYICSSLNPHQSSSGTLSYALGSGCAVISTPFLSAKELLTKNNGILLDDFKSSELISKAVINLLSNSKLRETMRKNAYDSTRKTTWSNVAESYKKVFKIVLDKANIESKKINSYY